MSSARVGNRCTHGVWSADHCYSCEREQPMSRDSVAVLRERLAEEYRHAGKGYAEAERRIAAYEAAIAALTREAAPQATSGAGSAPVGVELRDAKDVDFVAKMHGDWWTLQTLCGPTPRAYAIRKQDGALFELPDDRTPFAIFPALEKERAE